MVDKNEIRAAFAARLHQALDLAGVRSRGRGVDVQKALSDYGLSKTPQAVSKWLNGESIPEPNSMRALSKWLNVRLEWLHFGVEPHSAALVKDAIAYPRSQHLDGQPSQFRQVPLVPWAAVDEWCNVERSSDFKNASWLACPAEISPKGFALRVSGDSMTNAAAGRSYPQGSIIYADPAQFAALGDRVIARVPRSNEATFKIFVEDGGRKYLRAINAQYPLIDITDSVHIYAKVIGSFIPD